MMYHTILVPLDGSAFSERALPIATTLARTLRAQVILVRAASAAVFPRTDPTEAQVQAVDEAQAYLSALAAGLSEQDLNIEVAVPYGDAAELILLEIGLHSAVLVVMCTHGRSGLGRWIYGSVAEQVLARSPAPVLLVRPTSSTETLGPQRGETTVLVPLDGSAFAEAALPHAAMLTRALGGTILLVRATEPETASYRSSGRVQDDSAGLILDAEPYLEDVAQRLRSTGLSVQTVLEEGPPGEAIADHSAAVGTGLIIMTTHGRMGIARAFLGSVALEVVRRSPLPVMLIRPTGQLAEQPPVSASV
jgi:nucleotide-binding universal stress UspA family protein